MLKPVLTSPLLSLILVASGTAFFLTFITVDLNFRNVPDAIIGYIHSAYYAGLLISAIKIETIISRIGHIRAFTVFASLATSTIILQALFFEPMLWIIFRFIAGIAIAGLYVAIESWLLEDSTPQTRGHVLAIYMFYLYFAQAAGQYIIDTIDIKSFEPYFVASLLCALASVPVAMTYRPSPELKQVPKLKLIKYFNASPLGFIACICSGLMLSVIYGFMPGFAQDNGFSVSAVMSSILIGGFILQWPIGKLSDIYNRNIVLSAVSLLVIIPCMVIALSTKGSYTMMIFCFLLGGFSFSIYPLGISCVCDHVAYENIIPATGALLFSYGLGSVAGPLIIPTFIKQFSSDSVLWYLASIAVILGAIGGITTFRKQPATKPSVDNSDQIECVPMPNLTPIANELDPRAPSEEEDIEQVDKSDGV